MNGNGSEAEIDLSRERLVNDDGSVSTDLTITVQADGEHLNIPTVIDGQRRTPDEALRLWQAGLNPELGRYASLEEAGSAASERSRRIGDILADQEAGVAAPPAASAPQQGAPEPRPAMTPEQELAITWARTFGTLAPAPATTPAAGQPSGRRAAAPPEPGPKKPEMTWAQRREQLDYQQGSIETRQRIQEKWYREWEDWSERAFKKKGDTSKFRDALYEAVPRERFPDRTWGDSWRDNTNELIGGSVGVGRGWGFVAENLFGMKPDQDPNSLLYLFTQKGSEEFGAAMADAGSVRKKELAKIKAERLKAVENQGALASAAAIAQFYKDYPAEIWYGGVSTVPLIAEIVATGGLGKGLGLLSVSKRVAQGTLSVKNATRVVKAAQAAGVGVPYGTGFSAEVYDGVTQALLDIPEQQWLTDPQYIEMVKAQPGKSHDDIVRFIARDRAFWPSIIMGTVAGTTGPLLGIDHALVGPASTALREHLAKAIGAQKALAKVVASKAAGAAARVAGASFGESIEEAGEGVAKAWAENRAVAETAPSMAKPSRYGVEAAEGFVLGLAAAAPAGAVTARREAREAALRQEERVAAGRGAPGPPGPPGAPGAAPAGAPAAPGVAPAAAAAPAADLPARIVQASDRVGEAAFGSGLGTRLAALPEQATDEQRQAVLAGYVDEILGGRQQAAAPGPPSPTEQPPSVQAAPPLEVGPSVAAAPGAVTIAPAQPPLPGAQTVREAPQARPETPQITPEGAPVEPAAFRLPGALAKIAQRYGYKDRNFEVAFANDFDRATYTLAQQPKNKRHNEILGLLLDTGLTEEQLVDHGKRVRGRLKEWAQGAPVESTRLRLPAVLSPARLTAAEVAAREDALAESSAQRSEAASVRMKKAQRVDPARDSLLTAIAKLGGINGAAAEGEWGVDPAARPISNVFGLPVLRRDGGLTIDGMGEALAQLGYLELDENGKHDPRDLEAKFDLELRGQPQFTPVGQEARMPADMEREAEIRAEAEASAPIAEAAELTPDELAGTGYFGLPNVDEQRAAEAIVLALRGKFTGPRAEAAIDRIIERAAIAAEGNPNPAAFRMAIVDELRKERARGPAAKEPAPAERATPRQSGEKPGEAPRSAPPRQAAIPAVRPAGVEAGAVELAAPTPSQARAPRAEPATAPEEGGPSRTAIAAAGPPISREWVRESLPHAQDTPELSNLRDALRVAMDNLEAVRAQNAKDIAAATDPEAAGVAALRKADALRAEVEQAVAAVQDATALPGVLRVEPGDNAYVKQLQQKVENSLGAAETALEEFRSLSQLTGATGERTDEEVAMLQQAKAGLLKDRVQARQAARQWASYVDAARASRKRAKNPTNENVFKRAIGRIFGIAPEEFERRLPRVFIVSENEIHDGDKLTLRRGGKTYEIKGLTPDEAAFYHWDANVLVFFKERIEQGEERAAFLHEAVHKRGEQFLGKEQMDRFRKEFDGWKNAPRGSPERAIYGAVQQRLEVATAGDVGKPLVSAARRAEEILPYIVSEAALRGLEVNPNDVLRPGVRGLLARLWQALTRAVARTLGLSNQDAANAKLTVADVVVMAWGAAHLELDAPALEAITQGKPLPRGTKLPGIEAARKALEARPIFGARIAELLAGKNIYVPEAVPAAQRRFVTRFLETTTGQTTFARLKKQEIAEVATALARAPAPGPDNPELSSAIFKQPRKAVAVRTRKDLADFAQTGRRPDVPFLPVLKEWLVENIVDNQRPFLRWLRENSLGRAAWDKLKLVTGRVRERAELYNREILNPISREVAKFANDAGVDNEQAALVVGWWATLRHVPEANAALQMKLVRRIAAGDRGAVQELRRFVETQQGRHPNLGDRERGAMAAGLTDAEAARHTQQIVARYNAQQQRDIARISDIIVASFARLKRDAIDSGQISSAAAAQFPNFKYYVALTGDNSPVWDADQASDAFGSYIAESRLRTREGRAGDTVSESAIEALAERMGRVASYYGSVPFKEELNNIYTLAGAQDNTIGLERLPANAVQQPQHSDIVWTGPNGTRYIFRFSQSSSIGQAILGQNRVETDGLILKAMDWLTRRFSRAVTQWVPLFGPINALRDVSEKSKLIRARGVVDQNEKPLNVNALFTTTWKYARSADMWRVASALAFGANKRASGATQLGQWSNELVEDGGISTWGEITRRGLDTIRSGIEREAALAGLSGVREKWWENAKEFVARYNLMFEIVSSLSANAALRELGVERTKASAETLDLMNFSNVGAKTKWARAAYAFFNPAVQSGYNLARQLSTKRGQRDFLIVFVLASLIQGLMRIFGDDDPELGAELDQRGAWELDRSVPVKLFGTIIKLPVGFGMSQLAWSLSNTVGRLFSGRYSAGDAASQAAVSLLKTFNPVPISEVPPSKQPANFILKTFAPTAARPLVDMATDTDAWGSKLTTYYPDKSKLRAEQGKVGTPQTYKEIARSLSGFGIDIYPEHVRSIKEIIALGPVGYAIDSYVESSKEQEGRRLNALDSIPGSSLLRITGASRVIGGTSRYLEARYYEKLDAVLQDRRLYNQAKSLGRGQQWERENQDRMRRLRAIEAHEATMRGLAKEFNAAMRELQKDKLMFGAARTKFERISNEREKAMRELLRLTQDPDWNVDAVKGVTP